MPFNFASLNSNHHKKNVSLPTASETDYHEDNSLPLRHKQQTLIDQIHTMEAPTGAVASLQAQIDSLTSSLALVLDKYESVE